MSWNLPGCRPVDAWRPGPLHRRPSRCRRRRSGADAVGLLGLVLLLFGVWTFDSTEPGGGEEFLESFVATGTIGYILVVLFWGSRIAAAAMVREIVDKTWDQQRLSSMGAWGMTWGKLFGSTSYVWYGCGLLLAVALISLGLIEAHYGVVSEEMGRDVHPMLSTRGVPGTHDTKLMRSVIDDLKAGENTEVPHFDKAEDDRGGYTPVVSRDLSLLIIEGWCWGAMPAASDELDHPVNDLEKEEDPDGRWRHYVNEQLAHGGYQEIFDEAHTCLFLSVPDLEAVVRWRWQQEQRLAETRSDGSRIMTESQVRRFIMHYERITRRMLEKMPERANITLYIDDQHRIGPPPRK